MSQLKLAKGPYEANWDSLIGYGLPDWFRDCKFGIYAHWMLPAVPAFGNEWYGKWMYDPSNPIHAEHIKRYGPVAKAGYKEFIPQFTAEKYDPAAWADLLQRSGAHYGGFSLAHHDGFGLWDSDVYKWNVGKMGPKRDLYGEFVGELRKRDIRVVAPLHVIRGFNWFLPGWNQWDQSYNKEAVKQGQAEGWDLFDPAYADFYWNQFTAKFDDFLTQWKRIVVEVIDKYAPDVMWFDGGRFQDPGMEQHALDVLAHYFNRSEEWGRKVTVLNKLNITLIRNFPEEFGIWNYEAGRDRPPEVDHLWNDDMKIGDPSWAYVEDQQYVRGKEILHGLIDRVSRGGSLMLSLSPRADGTIPEGQVEALERVGQWLRANGEAIFDTRPWVVAAEGDPAKLIDRSRDKHSRWVFNNLGVDDIRYTASPGGRSIYAISLGRPTAAVAFPALGKKTGHLQNPIVSVSLVESNAAVAWRHEEEALVIESPSGVTASNEDACAWRIDT